MFEVIGNKIKYKYEGFEWNRQPTPRVDVFENIDQVNQVCGNGDTFKEAMCWLDAYNWSLMNKTKLTEDIYQFITHRAVLIRTSLEREWSNFVVEDNEVTREMRAGLISFLVDYGTNLLNFINLILGVFM